MKTLDLFMLDNVPADPAALIEEKLDHLGIPAKVVGTDVGPTLTQYRLDLDPATSVARLMSARLDLQVALGVSSLDIVIPILGTTYIGLAIPSTERTTVSLREVMSEPETGVLQFALGQDTTNRNVAPDLVSMPHLLIAGSTGSGKSVCINALICSLLARFGPEIVRFVLMDFKRVELAPYEGIPHLLFPIVTDVERAVPVLDWLVAEMERRYERLLSTGVRNIGQYQKAGGEMPYIVVIVDEMADLMLRNGTLAEPPIIRLAQKSRAVGIHLVLATQRPTVNVVTGLIKANIPSRIAFAVASSTDSRVILDAPGAEMLTGMGDMLFAPTGQARPTRVQGVYVSDEEIARITDYWKEGPSGSV